MNEGQKAAAEANVDQPLMILAGPGSGKTTTLVHRCLYIHSQLPTSRFLVLTFSTAAAEETRNRFRQLLSASSSSSFDTSFCDITTFHR